MTEAGRPCSARWTHAAATVLLLAAPFVIFLRHHAYSLSQPEALGCLAVLTGLGLGAGFVAATHRTMAATVLASLVAAFVDVQFVFDARSVGLGKPALLAGIFACIWIAVFWFPTACSRLLTTAAAVMLSSTLLLPAGRLSWREEQPGNGSNDLPFVLHVVLDEQIGIGGIPEAQAGSLRQPWQTWLASENFRVLAGAYSEWAETRQALAHALSLSPRSRAAGLVAAAEAPFTNRLARSAYFDRLNDLGYEMHVYQTAYFDLCAAARAALCHTYGNTQLGALQAEPLTALDKATVIAASYTGRSRALRELHGWLRTMNTRGLAVPVWSWERMRVGPIATMRATDRLADDLKTAGRGEFVLAHLLLPHYPYVYDAECRIRPVADWLDPGPPDLVNTKNTPETRALRYGRYAGHSQCAMRQVSRLLDAIPADVRADAIVILHGDHGPKISLHESTEPNVTRLATSDYHDTYSVLFAVRRRGLEIADDGAQVPIGCALAVFFKSGFRSLAVDDCRGPTTVPFRREAGQYVERPLPQFRTATP